MACPRCKVSARAWPAEKISVEIVSLSLMWTARASGWTPAHWCTQKDQPSHPVSQAMLEGSDLVADDAAGEAGEEDEEDTPSLGPLPAGDPLSPGSTHGRLPGPNLYGSIPVRGVRSRKLKPGSTDPLLLDTNLLTLPAPPYDPSIWSMAWSRTLHPAARSSGVAFSISAWLMPFSHGTKTIPAGVVRAMEQASCPARETMSRWL